MHCYYDDEHWKVDAQKLQKMHDSGSTPISHWSFYDGAMLIAKITNPSVTFDGLVMAKK